MAQVWPFKPLVEYSETLSWLTSVHQAKEAEQRSSLRTRPRQTYDFSYAMTPSQFSRAKLITEHLFDDGGDGSVLLPIWTDLQVLGGVSSGATTLTVDTTTSHYADGGQAILWESDTVFEAVTIDTVSAGSLTLTESVSRDYTGARVMPLCEAWFTSRFRVSRTPESVQYADAEFLVPQISDLSDDSLYDSYLSHAVLSDPSVVTSSIRETYGLDLDDFDTETGLVYQRTKRNYGSTRSVMTWIKSGKADAWSLRQWLHSRRGQCKSFWAPSWNNDFSLAAPIGAADTEITITDGGWIAADSLHIAVIPWSGAPTYHQVDSIAGNSDGTETLNLASAAGIDLAVSDVKKICLLRMMRFSADRIEIEHTGAGKVSVSVPVIECPIP